MRHFFQKPFVGALVYGTLLVLFTAYVLLDAFVIPRAGVPVVADTAVLASAVTQQQRAAGYLCQRGDSDRHQL